MTFRHPYCYFTPLQYLSPNFPIPLQVAYTLLFLSTGRPAPLALLVSVVAPGYILTSEDWS